METNETLATAAPEIVGGDMPADNVGQTDVVQLPEKVLGEEPSEHTADVLAASKRSVKSNPKAKAVVAKLLKEAIEAKVDKPPKAPKVQDRTGYTIHFYGEEQQYVKNIFEARKEVGASTDFTHFLRQAIDFAINFNSQLPQLEKKVKFSVPEQTTILLKNGFYDQK